jgi:CBS domain-containing protein
MESVKDLLKNKNELITIRSGTSVYDTVLFMANKSVGLVPVMQDEKLIGVFSERDLVKRVIAKNLDLESTKVDEVMSTQLILADINEGYESVLKKMKDAKIRHIVVIENQKLAGVLSMRDLLEIDINVCKSTVEVLHNYIYAK